MKPHPAERPDPTLESRAILDDLRRLVRGLRLYARYCETHLGLSAAQLFALRRLSEGAPMDLRGLAQATLTDVSSVSVVAERLRAKGLIHRRPSPEDGRRAELSLTPVGEDLLRRSPDPLQERMVASLAALPARRREALQQDLRRLLRDTGLDAERPRLFFEEE